jgi:hypothetical protein
LASLGRKTARLARKLALLVEIAVLSPPLCSQSYRLNH